jgi:hypothetical protein
MQALQDGQRTRVLAIDHATARSGGQIALLRTIRALDKTRLELLVALPSDRGMLPEALVDTPSVQLRVVPTDPSLLGMHKRSALGTVLKQPRLAVALIQLVARDGNAVSMGNERGGGYRASGRRRFDRVGAGWSRGIAGNGHHCERRGRTN